MDVNSGQHVRTVGTSVRVRSGRWRRYLTVVLAATVVGGLAAPAATAAPIRTASRVAVAGVEPDGQTSSDAVAGDAAPSGPVAATTGAADAGMHAVPAARILDTRSALGARGPVAAGGSMTIRVTGSGGVPASGVTMVVLMVTVPAPTAAGAIVVTAGGTAASSIPQVRFNPGSGVTTQVWAPVSATGQVSFTNRSQVPVHLLADTTAYQGAGEDPGSFTAVTPMRLVDTRARLGATAAVPARGSLTFRVGGRAGVPGEGRASSVLLSVTAVDPKGAGWLAAGTSGGPPRSSSGSQLNWSAGLPATGPVWVTPTWDGDVTIGNMGPAAIHLQIDVLGYLQLSGAQPDRLSVYPPVRIADSRTGQGWSPAQALQARHQKTVGVTGVGEIPRSGVAAVLVQVTAIDPTAPGTVLVTTGPTTGPAGIAVKFGAGQNRGSPILLPVADDGTITVTNASTSGRVDIAVDALGWIPTEPRPLLTFTRPAAGTGLSVVDALDCPTVTFCLAVNRDGASARWNGSVWTLVGGTPLPSGISAVSCGAASDCLAVFGSNGVRRFDGTTWSAPAAPAADNLSSVSCWSTTACAVAALDSGASWVWNGRTWTSRPLPFTHDPGNPSPEVWSLSCASADFCQAVGYRGAWQWAGNGWTDLRDWPWAGSYVDVDCPDIGFCVASAQLTGEMVTTIDGSVRDDSVDWGEEMGSVSCADRTLCFAVSGTDQVAWWDGTNWTEPANPPTVAGEPDFVSCPSPSLCIAVERDGGYLVGRR